MTFKYTSEQEEIKEAIVNSDKSIIIESGAGCAKTSTLKYAAQDISGQALAVAFNRSIAQDMEDAVPKNFTVRTMNGLGHESWISGALKGLDPTLDNRKLGKVVTEVSKKLKIKLEGNLRSDVEELTSEIMAVGIVPESDKCAENTMIKDTAKNWQDIAKGLGINENAFDKAYKISREVLIKNIDMARRGVISFDDQIYCSVMLEGNFTKFPIVFVDEDQDLSPMNIQMIKKCLAPEGRIVAVGDKRQAIYAWRGAAGDSAERIKKLQEEGSWLELPLLTSFRCPKVVVKRQQKHLPGFRAWDQCHTGEVLNWIPSDYNKVNDWSWKDLKKLISNTPSKNEYASLHILCRHNAPLFEMAIKLLKQGIGSRMLGRDIGVGLTSLVRKLAPDNKTSSKILLVLIESWRNKELVKAIADENDRKIESVSDRADCLKALLENAGCRTASDLTFVIENIFTDEKSAVSLSSVHRAKGLEWDNVIILDPYRIRHKPLEEGADRTLMKNIIAEQEWNLKYVAETRTRHTLVLANSANFK
jgi:superfamily I DNA/RNA helicase